MRYTKIALSGRMGSGKTTASNYIAAISPEAFQISFASKLKEVVQDLFDPPEKDRKLLIEVGEKMRQIDPQVWARYTLRQAAKHDLVVIDDLRLPVEYDLLKKAGYTTIRLEISPKLQKERLQQCYPETWRQHWQCAQDPTEQYLQNTNLYPFDYTINIDQENVNRKLASILFPEGPSPKVKD